MGGPAAADAARPVGGARPAGRGAVADRRRRTEGSGGRRPSSATACSPPPSPRSTRATAWPGGRCSRSAPSSTRARTRLDPGDGRARPRTRRRLPRHVRARRTRRRRRLPRRRHVAGRDRGDARSDPGTWPSTRAISSPPTGPTRWSSTRPRRSPACSPPPAPPTRSAPRLEDLAAARRHRDRLPTRGPRHPPRAARPSPTPPPTLRGSALPAHAREAQRSATARLGRMLDHLSIQCADLDASKAFYDAVLATLGGERIFDFGDAVGYGVPPFPTSGSAASRPATASANRTSPSPRPTGRRSARSSTRPSRRAPRSSTSRASGPSTTSTTTAPSSATPTATTSRRSATSPSREPTTQSR